MSFIFTNTKQYGVLILNIMTAQLVSMLTIFKTIAGILLNLNIR